MEVRETQTPDPSKAATTAAGPKGGDTEALEAASSQWLSHNDTRTIMRIMVTTGGAPGHLTRPSIPAQLLAFLTPLFSRCSSPHSPRGRGGCLPARRGGYRWSWP